MNAPLRVPTSTRTPLIADSSRASGYSPCLSAGDARREHAASHAERRAERERDRYIADTDSVLGDEQPAVASERVVEPAAGHRAKRHAQGGDGRNRAEHRAHDPFAEVLADDHRVERHHSAVGETERD